MKKRLNLLIAFQIFVLTSCGDKIAKTEQSKVMNTSVRESLNADIYAPEVEFEVKGSGGNDAWMLNWYNWYTGGKTKIPTCGPEKISEQCINPSSDMEDICRHESNKVRDTNFKLGYYLEKVDNYQFCKQKCTPSKPTCDGLSCIPNVLSYAGKQILKATQACQGACQDAITMGMEFPYECKNINDNYDRKTLIDEIEAERAKLLADPERTAQAAHLAAIISEREEIERRIEQMKKAEADLPGWITSVYTPGVATLTNEMKKADDKILSLYVRVKEEVEPVQDVATEIQKQFSEKIPELNQLEKNQQNIERVRPKACLAYDFRTAVDEGKAVQEKLKSLTDDLLTKLTEVGNIPLYEEGRAGVENLLNKVNPTPVDENLLDGSLFRDICNHYRKMIMVNSLLISKAKVDNLQNGIGELIDTLNSLILGIDTFNNGLKFKESILNQSEKITSALTQARLRSQWNTGNRIAFDGMKALHLVFIPSIELNNDLTEEEKNKLIDQIRTNIEKTIRDWNKKANDLGLQGMVESRQFKINNLIFTTTSKINDRSNYSEKRALLSEFHRTIEKATLRVDLKNSQVQKSGNTAADLVEYDDQLSELENLVREFNKINFGGRQ